MIAKPSIAFNDFSGTAKDVTARSVNGRNVLSVRAQQSKIVTPAQAVSRNKLSKISRAYKQLSDSQMTAWGTLASHLKGISTFGSPAELTPHNAFVRINSNRAMVGMPLLTEAPVYKSDVPEVQYEDLWISPDAIVFTGLEVPSESYRLVVKMSPAQSPGTTNGWSKTVVVAPGIVPDWGDADVTKLYTETICVTPEAGKKYYLECWWLDTETGFTGESMWVSAVCKTGSTAYNTEYVPRVRLTDENIEYNEGVSDLDMEFSPGSAICSIKARLNGHSNVASSKFTTKRFPEKIITGTGYMLARCTEENDYLPQSYEIQIYEDKWDKELRVSFMHRGCSYEIPADAIGNAVFF